MLSSAINSLDLIYCKISIPSMKKIEYIADKGELFEL